MLIAVDTVNAAVDDEHQSVHPWVAATRIGRWQMGIIVFLIVGAIAGWLAGQVVKGGGFGLVGDIIVGILGAIIAGFLFPSLGISLGAGLIGEIISAAIGAIILLFIIRLVKRA